MDCSWSNEFFHSYAQGPGQDTSSWGVGKALELYAKGPEFESRCNPGFFCIIQNDREDRTGQGTRLRVRTRSVEEQAESPEETKRSDAPHADHNRAKFSTGGKSETNQMILPMIESSV